MPKRRPPITFERYAIVVVSEKGAKVIAERYYGFAYAQMVAEYHRIATDNSHADVVLIGYTDDSRSYSLRSTLLPI